MQQVSDVANGGVLWLLTILILALVVGQALAFLVMSLRFSDRFGIVTPDEKRTIYKTAAINSVGPAIAVVFVAISLIALVGGPVTLMRVGVIGSATFELYAANQGALAAGAKIGTDSYTLTAFTASVWAMTLGGMGWLITAFFFTRRLGRAQTSIRKSNPALLLTLSALTPIAVFGVLAVGTFLQKKGFSDMSIKTDSLVAVLAAALGMILLRMLGRSMPWIREWALGFSLVTGLIAGYVASTTLA